MEISFQAKGIIFPDIPRLPVKNWIKSVIGQENLIQNKVYTAGEINIILVSDQYLYELNQKYLNRNDYTDIITFDYNEENIVNGDLVISLDRVEENANSFEISPEKELLRVIIHGILHLMGYKDGSNAEKGVMTEKENYYLQQFKYP